MVGGGTSTRVGISFPVFLQQGYANNKYKCFQLNNNNYYNKQKQSHTVVSVASASTETVTEAAAAAITRSSNTQSKSLRPAVGNIQMNANNTPSLKNDSISAVAIAASKDQQQKGLSLKDYFDQSNQMIIRSDANTNAPPRWFSPLECGSQAHQSPLLLFLPGIDGVGLGLILHHQRLGKIFDIWCLHIPVTDRTPFPDLIEMVERAVRTESDRLPNRPIYLVGESVGACLALSVAARNPHIDLLLILANPATSFGKSPLQPILSILQMMPGQLYQTLPFALASLTGIPLKLVMTILEKGLSLEQTIGELSESLGAFSNYLQVLADNLLPGETLVWKLQMLKQASTYANSRLHAVKAQTLVLSSGRDLLLPSEEEGERLRSILPKCEIRKFSDSGHALFLEEDFDLVTTIKGACFYRRTRNFDYVSDYMPPTPSEFAKASENVRWFEIATAPVMLSTLEDGKIVRDLSGIPSTGPVLFVGYHMLLGLELYPMVSRLWKEKNILLRGVGHPMMFRKLRDDGMLPDLSSFDVMRLMGAVPVSPMNMYKLFASKSHVLLYPGGVREALHRKGEEYKLFWPEQAEFVRMAARFGATIVPFGAVGEDDVAQIIFDYNDLMKIPYFKNAIAELTDESGRLRTESKGEVSNQDVHMPIMLPKPPGRFYYLFGKPIKTEGRRNDLRSREESHRLYLEIKSEVENCMAFLKEKREHDPYRDLHSRILYQASHGFNSQVPTFEI